jgi:hypothetical protein
MKDLKSSLTRPLLGPTATQFALLSCTINFAREEEGYAACVYALLDSDGNQIGTQTLDLTKRDVDNWGEDDQYLVALVKEKLYETP